MSEEENMEALEESEDLFGFDEIYTPPVRLDVGKKPDAGNSASPAEAAEVEEAPVFDESDCLFNFDELGVEADTVKVDAAAVLESVPAAKPAGSDTPTAPVPDVTAAQPAASAAATAVAEPVAAPVQQLTQTFVPAQSFSFKSPTFWVLIAFTMINLGMIGFTWGISGRMRDEVGDATRFIIQATQEIQAQTGEHVTKLESFQSPVVAEDPQHENAFERAREDLDRGDHAGVQRRMYALLAVTDRLDPDIRDDVEATAQFVLADVAMQVALFAPEELP